jgi:hypothetical protein
MLTYLVGCIHGSANVVDQVVGAAITVDAEWPYCSRQPAENSRRFSLQRRAAGRRAANHNIAKSKESGPFSESNCAAIEVNPVGTNACFANDSSVGEIRKLGHSDSLA